jgi:hypothetical protein
MMTGAITQGGGGGQWGEGAAREDVLKVPPLEKCVVRPKVGRPPIRLGGDIVIMHFILRNNIDATWGRRPSAGRFGAAGARYWWGLLRYAG